MREMQIFKSMEKYFNNSMDEDLNLQAETSLVMLRQLATNGMHNYILLNFGETHREGFQKSFLAAFTCSIFSMPINYDFSQFQLFHYFNLYNVLPIFKVILTFYFQNFCWKSLHAFIFKVS